LALHRKIFDKTIPHKFTARLWLRDTINQIESFDEVLIDHTRPDASLMTLSSGIPCPFNGYSLDYVLNFKLNTGTQSYFAVNFDSIANPTGFIPYDQGILAPPSPGLPIPFVLPYDIRGSLGDEFVKGYTQGEVGSDPKLRSPNGSFTMGLIVGNGPSVGSSPATCLDTAWYRDIFRIPYLNASFDILSPATSIKSICAGESAYFNIQKPIQNDISILRWAWGYQGLGKGPNLDLYVEQFTYMEKYDGPSPTRNDRNIAYNGEDWYYNYVVRGGINDALGFHTTDTIVTSIVKDWKIETKFNNVEDIQLFTNGLGYNEIDKKDLHKLWGDGTFGCIDTTGLSNLVEINKKEYRNYNGDNVFLHGDKRYRYTDESKTDSIEVAHILHFRDSSLQGYDTLIQGADTTFGVWKKQYRHAKINNGDTAYHASSGPMVPTLFLNNTSGCESRSAELLNVGFQNDYWFENDDALCSGLNLFIKDDIRYYQYGEEDPFTYPINAYPYWQDPVRYVNNSEYHIVDWDSADSWNPQRSIVLNHLYTEPGIYTITIVAKDSMGCKDTTYLTKEITEISIDFEYDTLINSCEGKTDFLDKTSTSSSSDEISTWEWDFGDGTRKSLLQNPTHTYSRSGFFDVKLIVRSSSGCMDSVMKRILVAGPQPEFEFANNPGMIGDTIEIYVSDSINVNNLSKGVGIKDPTFAMDWGDGSFSSPPRDGQSFGHSYTQSGIYNLYLIMEAALPNGYRCSKIYPDTISKAHTVVVRVLPDSLNNIREINNRILIYPNPSTGSFSIEIEDGTKLLTVKLYDLLSREVSIEMLDSTTSYKVLDKIVSGTYLLKVHTEQGIITKKLLFNMD
ncbi:MAG: PKD domain-containing protein, partial [Bacteroidia bacterium]